MTFLFVLYVIFVLFPSALRAATLEDSAKVEAEVVLYSSLNNEQIVTLVEAFRKKYPFIKPSFYRGTSERVLQRAFTEAKAGRFAVDFVTSAGFQAQLMKESGLTQRFIPDSACSATRAEFPATATSIRKFFRCGTSSCSRAIRG